MRYLEYDIKKDGTYFVASRDKGSLVVEQSASILRRPALGTYTLPGCERGAMRRGPRPRLVHLRVGCAVTEGGLDLDLDLEFDSGFGSLARSVMASAGMRGPSWAILLSPLFLIGIGVVIRDGCVGAFPSGPVRTSGPVAPARVGNVEDAQTTSPPPRGRVELTSATPLVQERDAAAEPDSAAPPLITRQALDDFFSFAVVVPDPDAGAIVIEAAATTEAPADVEASPADAGAGGATASTTPDAAAAPSFPPPVLGWNWATTSGAWSFGVEPPNVPAPVDARSPAIDPQLLRAAYLLALASALDPTALPSTPPQPGTLVPPLAPGLSVGATSPGLPISPAPAAPASPNAPPLVSPTGP